MADTGREQCIPSTNRGYSEFINDQETWCGFDFCAFSIDLPLFFEVSGNENTQDLLEFPEIPEFAHDAAKLIHAFFFDKNILLSDEVRKGRFYKSVIALNDANGKNIGRIELGGDTARKNGSKTARVELTGEGCRLFETIEAMPDHAKRWLELRAKLESVDGRLSRVDIAYDDFKGENKISHALAMWREGAFDARGQHPHAEHLDDLGSGKGSTAYIGSKNSEKFLRVYEKGKQLGDITSPWVRWEVQFTKSVRKELSLDVLRDPLGYFRGAYPVLQFIKACMLRFEASQIKDLACLKSVMRHAKKQYGALLNFASHYHKEDADLGKFVRNNLTRPKLADYAYQILNGKTSIPILHQ